MHDSLRVVGHRYIYVGTSGGSVVVIDQDKLSIVQMAPRLTAKRGPLHNPQSFSLKCAWRLWMKCVYVAH
jgi:acetate kinase